MAKEIKYLINGRIYTFKILKIDGGIPYGRCYKTKSEGWLYDDHIFIKDKGIFMAEKIE